MSRCRSEARSCSMLVALRMVFPTGQGVYGEQPHGEPFIVPLAVPALAGPSALATVLLFVSKEPGRWVEWLAAIAGVMAISAVVLSFSGRLFALLGERVTLAFVRLMGLVLAAIAVELMLRGIRTFMGTLSTTHLLFEEDGAFKAGTVLTSTDASHQVELASGKRTKVKGSHVLLQFREPAPSTLLGTGAVGGRRHRPGLPVGSRAPGGVRLPGSRPRVLREGTWKRRGGVAAVSPALGAGVLPSQGPGPLPGSARGNAEGRPRRARTQAAAGRAEAAARVGIEGGAGARRDSAAGDRPAGEAGQELDRVQGCRAGRQRTPRLPRATANGSGTIATASNAALAACMIACLLAMLANEGAPITP